MDRREMPCTAAALTMDYELDAVTVAEEIDDFLDGRTAGEVLLHALYDYVLDEPVPQRLLSVLRR